jgi:hypothetical protein
MLEKLVSPIDGFDLKVEMIPLITTNPNTFSFLCHKPGNGEMVNGSPVERQVKATRDGRVTYLNLIMRGMI